MKKNYPCHHRLYIIRSLVQINIYANTEWTCMCHTTPFDYHSCPNTLYPTILIFCSTSQHKGREVFSCWNNTQGFITQAALGRRAVSDSVWEQRTKMNREQLCWSCHGLSITLGSAMGVFWGQGLSCSQKSLLTSPHLGEDRNAFPLGLNSPRLNT